MLTHLGRDVTVHALGFLVQALDRELRLNDRTRLIVFQTIHGTPIVDLVPPSLHCFRIGLQLLVLPDPQHLIEHAADIADNRKINRDVLVNG